jgi:hypothetical protein
MKSVALAMAMVFISITFLMSNPPPLALWSWCCLGYLLVFCASLWSVHVLPRATMLSFALLCCIMRSDKEHNVVILVSFILSK